MDGKKKKNYQLSTNEVIRLESKWDLGRRLGLISEQQEIPKVFILEGARYPRWQTNDVLKKKQQSDFIPV